MTRKALVVGIKPYPNFRGRNQRQDLANAPLDAEAIAQILRDYGRFEVKVLPETCAEGTYQVDEKGLVKAEMLQDAIYELFAEPADGKLPQTALLFFAGHGLAIDEYGETVGYLATSETNREQKKWGVRLDWLAKQLGQSQVSEQIVWLDCCHSGKLTQEIFEQAKPANQNDVKRFIIAACRDSETAYGVDGHGVLTHLLQKALDPEQYSVGYDINSSEIQAAVEREFNAHPKFKTYPQRPIFFSFGRPIHFWDGRGMRQPSRGMRQSSKQEYRNRQALLSQMGTEVESRLAQSLHHAVLLNLGKEQQPHQVQRPWDVSVKVGEQRSFQLPSETSILEVFKNPAMSGKFLILGKPGGGKTTTLLELAQALVERAETDSDAPIPVILELSEWQTVTKGWLWNKQEYDPSIKEWILSQLRSKGVSKEIGEQWIKEKELVLLLDGLDELPSERQKKCVQAINEFLDSEFSPLHLVVCSRKEEYEEYEEVLHLNGAICLEDLTVEQIQHYFASVNLGEFWESIKDSEKIVNFIRQPLFLAITSIAYQQIDVEEWRNCNTEERAIDYLIGIYCVVALGKEDIKSRSNFSQEKIKKIKLIHGSLIYLAKYLEWCKNPNFVVKNLQPFFLIQGEIFYQKTTFFVSVSFFLFFVYIVNLNLTKLNFDISSTILNFLSVLSFNSWQQILISIAVLSLIIFLIAIPLLLPAFLVFALFFYVYHEDNSININKFNLLNPFIAYRFTLYLIYSFYFLFSASLYIGFILLVFLTLSDAQTGKTDINILRSILKLLSFSISFSVIISPFYTLHEAILNNLELELRQTEKFDLSALFVNVLSIVIFCSLYYQLFLFLLTKFNIIPDVFSSIHPLGISVYIGVVCGGGYDLFKYFILRLIIFKFRYMPWNITRFLDYCTERLILQRVGYRYRFIHRLVQEHFANLEIQKE